MIPLKRHNAPASAAARLVSPTYTFTRLDTVVDEVHELFGTWEQEQRFSSSDDRLLQWARLAVHEWIANLVQHADFDKVDPEIHFACWERDEKLVCVIEDNSAGFDYDKELHVRSWENSKASPPERGMGLLMLNACAQEIRYRRHEGRLNQLQFTVSADQDPCLNIRF